MEHVPSPGCSSYVEHQLNEIIDLLHSEKWWTSSSLQENLCRDLKRSDDREVQLRALRTVRGCLSTESNSIQRDQAVLSKWNKSRRGEAASVFDSRSPSVGGNSFYPHIAQHPNNAYPTGVKAQESSAFPSSEIPSHTAQPPSLLQGAPVPPSSSNLAPHTSLSTPSYTFPSCDLSQAYDGFGFLNFAGNPSKSPEEGKFLQQPVGFGGFGVTLGEEGGRTHATTASEKFNESTSTCFEDDKPASSALQAAHLTAGFQQNEAAANPSVGSEGSMEIIAANSLSSPPANGVASVATNPAAGGMSITPSPFLSSADTSLFCRTPPPSFSGGSYGFEKCPTHTSEGTLIPPNGEQLQSSSYESSSHRNGGVSDAQNTANLSSFCAENSGGFRSTPSLSQTITSFFSVECAAAERADDKGYSKQSCVLGFPTSPGMVAEKFGTALLGGKGCSSSSLQHTPPSFSNQAAAGSSRRRHTHQRAEYITGFLSSYNHLQEDEKSLPSDLSKLSLSIDSIVQDGMLGDIIACLNPPTDGEIALESLLILYKLPWEDRELCVSIVNEHSIIEKTMKLLSFSMQSEILELFSPILRLLAKIVSLDHNMKQKLLDQPLSIEVITLLARLMRDLVSAQLTSRLMSPIASESQKREIMLFHFLSSLLHSSDEHIIYHALEGIRTGCEALHGVRLLLETPALSREMLLLAKLSNPEIVSSSLHILGKVAHLGSRKYISELVEIGILQVLLSLIMSMKSIPLIKALGCNIIGNIGCDGEAMAAAVVESNAIPSLLFVCWYNDHEKVRLEARYAVCATVGAANADHVKYITSCRPERLFSAHFLLNGDKKMEGDCDFTAWRFQLPNSREYGCLQLMNEMLEILKGANPDINNLKLCRTVLKGLGNILHHGEAEAVKCGFSANPYVEIFVGMRGNLSLAQLRFFPDFSVVTKTNALLEKYFFSPTVNFENSDS